MTATTTTTTVHWEDIPLMLENGWEIDLYSDSNQSAIMSKFGDHELDPATKLPVAMEPKRGQAQSPKPPHRPQQPPMHRK